MITIQINERHRVIGYALELIEGSNVDGVPYDGEVPEDFLDKYYLYDLIDEVLIKNPEHVTEKERQDIRDRRKSECFAIADRSELWYRSLTAEQLEEISMWYRGWLDAPETLVVPEKPEWLY